MLNRWPTPVDTAGRKWAHVGIVAAQGLFWVIVFCVVTLLGDVPFSAGDNLLAVAAQWGTLLTAALGAALVLSLGEIDLSSGSVAAFSGAVFALLVERLPSFPSSAVMIVGLLGLALGLLNALLVAVLRLPSPVATLGVGSVALGVSFAVGDGQMGMLGDPGASLAVCILLVFLLGLTVLLIGVYLAAGGRGSVERLAALEATPDGVPGSPLAAVVTRGLAFTVAGGLAAMAGVLTALRFGAGGPQIGSSMGLGCIAAGVLGGALLFHGRGRVLLSVGGAIGASLTVTVATYAVALLGANAAWTQLIAPVIILAAGIVSLVVRLIERSMDRSRPTAPLEVAQPGVRCG